MFFIFTESSIWTQDDNTTVLENNLIKIFLNLK